MAHRFKLPAAVNLPQRIQHASSRLLHTAKQKEEIGEIAKELCKTSRTLIGPKKAVDARDRHEGGVGLVRVVDSRTENITDF